METLIFAVVAILAGMTAYCIALSSLVVIGIIIALFLTFLPLALRRRKLVEQPLAAKFARLRADYSSQFGQTRSGEKFLRKISKPLPAEPSSLDKGLGDLMSAGQSVYGAVTDPISFVAGLALAPILGALDPVFEGVGAAIRRVVDGEKTDSQVRLEAALIRSLQAIQREREASNVCIVVAVLISLGITILYAYIPPPVTRTAEIASLASSTVAPTAETSTPKFTPFALTPESSRQPPLQDTPSQTPSPSKETFMTVAEAQRAAVLRYPALGVEGSKLNTEFVARYKFYQQTNPGYFTDVAWPIHLAQELTQTSQPR